MKVKISAAKIDLFPNPCPQRGYSIRIVNPEFTSLCPKTGLPDFGTITIRYVARRHCIELKSLKYYLLQFRNAGIYYEAAVNQILDDLATRCKPQWMEVEGHFKSRGGIITEVSAGYAATHAK